MFHTLSVYIYPLHICTLDNTYYTSQMYMNKKGLCTFLDFVALKICSTNMDLATPI